MLKFFEIGRLLKSFGKEGKIRYHVEDDYYDDFSNSSYVFVDIEGSVVPFYIDRNEESNSMLLLEGIQSPQEAESLTGNTLYLSAKEVSEKNSSAKVLDFSFVDYHLHDEQGLFIAKIVSIEEYPSQKMLVLSSGDLVPFHDDLVVNIDKIGKVLLYSIPEGLLGVNSKLL